MLSKYNCKSKHLMEKLLHHLESYQWKLSNIPFVFFPLVSRGTISSCTERHLWLKWLLFVINRALTIQVLHTVVCTNGQVSGLFFKIAVPAVELAHLYTISKQPGYILWNLLTWAEVNNFWWHQWILFGLQHIFFL